MGSFTDDPWKIPYPYPDDPPAGDAQLQALAERVHVDLTTVNKTATDAGTAVTDLAKLVDALRKPPLVQCRQTVAQNIAVGVFTTAITFNVNDLDPFGMHAVSDRIICKVAGWYQLSGQLSFSSNATGLRRGAGWYVNGQELSSHGIIVVTAAAGDSVIVPASTSVVWLKVNDYVQLRGFHNASSYITTYVTAGASAQPFACARKVADAY